MWGPVDLVMGWVGKPGGTALNSLPHSPATLARPVPGALDGQGVPASRSSRGSSTEGSQLTMMRTEGG